MRIVLDKTIVIIYYKAGFNNIVNFINPEQRSIRLYKPLKKGNIMIKNSILLIVAAVYMQPVLAHQIWIQKTDDKYEIAFGESVSNTDPLPFKKVDSVKGYTKNKFMDELHVSTEAYGESPDAGHVSFMPFMDYPVITAKMTNGYFVQVEDTTTEKGYTYLKGDNLSDIDTTGQTVLKTIYSIKFAKHITEWDWTLFWPVGQRLEIIPLTDVTQLKQGDTLKYLIYFEGKAINGEHTAIYPNSDPNLTKDENPKTELDGQYYVQQVTIGAPGLQTVVVKHKEMLNEEETKYTSMASVLTFYIAE